MTELSCCRAVLGWEQWAGKEEALVVEGMFRRLFQQSAEMGRAIRVGDRVNGKEKTKTRQGRENKQERASD